MIYDVMSKGAPNGIVKNFVKLASVHAARRPVVQCRERRSLRTTVSFRLFIGIGLAKVVPCCRRRKDCGCLSNNWILRHPQARPMEPSTCLQGFSMKSKTNIPA